MIYFVPVLLTILITHLLGSYKLMLLLKPFNAKISFLKLYHLNFLSWCLSLFIPGRIGELFLVYFLKKERVKLGVGSALVIMDKLIGLIVTFAIAVIGMFLLFSVTQSLKITLIFLIGLATFIYMIFSNFGRNIIKKLILRKWESKFAGFSKTLFGLMKKHKSSITYNFILSLIKWIANSFVLYILFYSFGQKVSILMVILVTATLAITSLIPLTTNGLGIKESVGVFIFTLIGIPSVITISVLLMSLIINYSVSLIYILLFYDWNINKTRLNNKINKKTN
jgi:uncharacterized protein (TIRG00374 family)